MRKRIVLGDMHGHIDSFKRIIAKEVPDDIIMLGDYVDACSLGHKQIKKNVLELFDILDNYYDNEDHHNICIVGNHDFHYMLGAWDEHYSGWNATTNFWARTVLNERLRLGKMQWCYIDEKNRTIYSHAGVTMKWLKETCNNDWQPGGIDIADINTLNMQYFRFDDSHGYDPYGDTPWNSPIWVRPMSLVESMYKGSDGITWTQVVGHTHMQRPLTPDNFLAQGLDRPLWIIDTLPDYYIVEMLDDDGMLLSREVANVTDAADAEAAVMPPVI